MLATGSFVYKYVGPNDRRRSELAVRAAAHLHRSVVFGDRPSVLYDRAMKTLLLSVLLLAATAAAERSTEKTPRMRDGHPDLSGNWSYATLTTLERPKELGDKAFLTEAEAAAFEKKTLATQ